MSALKSQPDRQEDTAELLVHLQGELSEQLRQTISRVKLPAASIGPMLQNIVAAMELAPAMEAAEAAASPQMARSLQARENWLRSIDDEFGTFTRQEVAELRGSPGKNRGMAADMQERGEIIAYRRGNAFRIPAFQLDVSGHALPVMPRIIAEAREAGWEDQDILVWLTNPNTHFPDGKRPVDCLGDVEGVMAALRASIEAQYE